MSKTHLIGKLYEERIQIAFLPLGLTAPAAKTKADEPSHKYSLDIPFYIIWWFPQIAFVQCSDYPKRLAPYQDWFGLFVVKHQGWARLRTGLNGFGVGSCEPGLHTPTPDRSLRPSALGARAPPGSATGSGPWSPDSALANTPVDVTTITPKKWKITKNQRLLLSANGKVK